MVQVKGDPVILKEFSDRVTEIEEAKKLGLETQWTARIDSIDPNLDQDLAT